MPLSNSLTKALLHGALGHSVCDDCGADLGFQPIPEGQSIQYTHCGDDGRDRCARCAGASDKPRGGQRFMRAGYAGLATVFAVNAATHRRIEAELDGKPITQLAVRDHDDADLPAHHIAVDMAGGRQLYFAVGASSGMEAVQMDTGPVFYVNGKPGWR